VIKFLALFSKSTAGAVGEDWLPLFSNLSQAFYLGHNQTHDNFMELYSKQSGIPSRLSKFFSSGKI
jgi:hypothetical protein